MGNFKQGGRGFDRGRSGGNRFGGGFNRGRNSRSDREMHNVTCTKCGKATQVPFKPTGSKPVLCSDCFRQDDPRRDSKSSDNSNQINQINAKLDKIISILETLEIVTDEEESEEEEQ